MNERRVPSLTKWPFYATDLLLLGLAIWILGHYPHPLAPWPATLLVACVAAACFLGVWPHRLEYQTAVKLAEAGALTDVVAEIRNAQTVAEQIRLATAQWQGVQDHSGKAVSAAKEIGERMAAEARAFSEFLEKANDSEKATLRLEVEKLRRGEGQWLQVLVHLLDHVFALYQAGARSGQPSLQQQLGQFQEACRDIARRVGLTPFEAAPDTTFDAERHQVVDGQPQPPPDTRIAQTLATGYTFQGQLLRRSVVELLPGVALEVDRPPAASGETPALEAELPEAKPSQAVRSSVGTTDSQAATPLAIEEHFRLEPEGLDTGGADTLRQA